MLVGIAFIAVLATTLASLTRVQTNLAAGAIDHDDARRYAHSAMLEALGELQRHAGHDTVATVTGDNLQARDGRLPRALPSLRHWTAVLDSAAAHPEDPSLPNPNRGRLLAWLVSGARCADPMARAAQRIRPQEKAADGRRRWVRLMPPASDADAPVYAERVPLRLACPHGQAATPPGGAFAWWVGDMGRRARIDLPHPADTPQALPRPPDPSGLPGLGNWNRIPEGERMRLRQVSALRLVGLGSDDVPDPAATYRHDLTTEGIMLATDSRHGGTRMDLGPAFDAKASILAGRPIFPPADATFEGAGIFRCGRLPPRPSGTLPPDGHDPGGPAWDSWLSYAGLCRTRGALPCSTPDKGGIAPAIHTFQATFTLVAMPREGGGQVLVWRCMPVVVLWNPWTRDIAAGTCTLVARRRSQGWDRKANPDSRLLEQQLRSVEWTDAGVRQRHYDIDAPSGIRDPLLVHIPHPVLHAGEARVFSLAQDHDGRSGRIPSLAPGLRPHCAITHVQGHPLTPNIPWILPPVRIKAQVYMQTTRTGCIELFAGNAVGGAPVVRIDGIGWLDKSKTSLTHVFDVPRAISDAMPLPGMSSRTPLPSAPTTIPTWGRRLQLRGPASPEVERFAFPLATQRTQAVRWLAWQNPVAARMGRRPAEAPLPETDGSGYATCATYLAYSCLQPAPQGSDPFAVPLLPGSDSAVPVMQDLNRCALVDVPELGDRGFFSVGQLMHAQLPLLRWEKTPGELLANDAGPAVQFTGSNTPLFALGGSSPDPQVPPDKTCAWLPARADGTGLERIRKPFAWQDLSLWLNASAWDSCWFSTAGTDGKAWNPRIVPLPSPETPTGSIRELSDEASLRVAATRLGIAGGFNVNSTSTAAWQALLDGMRPRGGAADACFAGIWQDPRRPDASDAAGTPMAPRPLTHADSAALASAIVREVKERGPFLSLADFINRSPTPPHDRTPDETLSCARQGTLDAAIGSARLDKPRGAAVQKPTDTDGAAYPSARIADGPIHSGLPAFPTQQRLLYHLAPLLGTRSDTFIIRAYGEKTDPADPARIAAKAWCEAIVQRIPEYLVPESAGGDAPWTHPSDLAHPVNQAFGRRFIITSFRWLDESEL